MATALLISLFCIDLACQIFPFNDFPAPVLIMTFHSRTEIFNKTFLLCMSGFSSTLNCGFLLQK